MTVTHKEEDEIDRKWTGGRESRWRWWGGEEVIVEQDGEKNTKRSISGGSSSSSSISVSLCLMSSVMTHSACQPLWPQPRTLYLLVQQQHRVQVSQGCQCFCFTFSLFYFSTLRLSEVKKSLCLIISAVRITVTWKWNMYFDLTCGPPPKIPASLSTNSNKQYQQCQQCQQYQKYQWNQQSHWDQQYQQ